MRQPLESDRGEKPADHAADIAPQRAGHVGVRLAPNCRQRTNLIHFRERRSPSARPPPSPPKKISTTCRFHSIPGRAIGDISDRHKAIAPIRQALALAAARVLRNIWARVRAPIEPCVGVTHAAIPATSAATSDSIWPAT